MLKRIINIPLLGIAFILIIAIGVFMPIIGYILGRGFNYYVEDFLNDYVEDLMFNGDGYSSLKKLFLLVIYDERIQRD